MVTWAPNTARVVGRASKGPSLALCEGGSALLSWPQFVHVSVHRWSSGSPRNLILTHHGLSLTASSGLLPPHHCRPRLEAGALSLSRSCAFSSLLLVVAVLSLPGACGPHLAGCQVGCLSLWLSGWLRSQCICSPAL